MYDVLIIGGGINGTGIARDAAGRGLRVLLCEQDDIAQHSSSASSKLIHGGLRYLEHYEFSLVRKALQEREVLLNIAPHIIWPMRFVLPHAPHLRPAWMIRAGLFLYDHLAKRKKLPQSQFVNLNKHSAGQFIKSEFSKGFEYSDAFVYDARLCILNAMDAKEHGADIRIQTKVLSAAANQGVWDIVIQSKGHVEQMVQASVIINASGPWVGKVLSKTLNATTHNAVRHVKGSHIVVPALFDHEYAYIFQNADQRVIFAIPFERNYTLVGTTDVAYQGNLNQVEISDDEQDYLCEVINQYFNRGITRQDIVSSFAGVRPLLDDNSGNLSAVTRDYLLETSYCDDSPVISVFGGKITTYRVLAEEVLVQLGKLIPVEKSAWTHSKSLPGGDIPQSDFAHFEADQKQRYAWLPSELVARYARLYGTRMHVFLKDKQGLTDMGEQLVSNLYAAEVDYLMQHEWAHTADDVLFRRTKLGLGMSSDDVANLENYMSNAQKMMSQ